MRDLQKRYSVRFIGLIACYAVDTNKKEGKKDVLFNRFWLLGAAVRLGDRLIQSRN